MWWLARFYTNIFFVFADLWCNTPLPCGTFSTYPRGKIIQLCGNYRLLFCKPHRACDSRNMGGTWLIQKKCQQWRQWKKIHRWTYYRWVIRPDRQCVAFGGLDMCPEWTWRCACVLRICFMIIRLECVNAVSLMYHTYITYTLHRVHLHVTYRSPTGLMPSSKLEVARFVVHALEIIFELLSKGERPKYINLFLLLLLFVQCPGSNAVVFFSFFLGGHTAGCVCDKCQVCMW